MQRKKLIIITILLIASFTVQSVSSNGTSGLVAYWDLNSTSGTVAEETINDFNGTVTGAIWTSGVFGNALEFDGVDDLVNVTQSAIATIGSLSQGTIAFWFKYVYNLDHREIQPLFYLGIDDTDELDTMFIIEIGHANPLNRRLYATWVVEGQIPLCFDTGSNLEENSWYHFAVVVGPTGNTGYLNGTELVGRHYNFGDQTYTNFLSSITVQDQLTFGYGKTDDSKSPTFLHYQGAMDEICIFDRPLSSAEILDLKNYGEPNTIPELNVSNLGFVALSILPIVALVISKKNTRKHWNV